MSTNYAYIHVYILPSTTALNAVLDPSATMYIFVDSEGTVVYAVSSFLRGKITTLLHNLWYIY